MSDRPSPWTTRVARATKKSHGLEHPPKTKDRTTGLKADRTKGSHPSFASEEKDILQAGVKETINQKANSPLVPSLEEKGRTSDVEKGMLGPTSAALGVYPEGDTPSKSPDENVSGRKKLQLAPGRPCNYEGSNDNASDVTTAVLPVGPTTTLSSWEADFPTVAEEQPGAVRVPGDVPSVDDGFTVTQQQHDPPSPPPLETLLSAEVVRPPPRAEVVSVGRNRNILIAVASLFGIGVTAAIVYLILSRGGGGSSAQAPTIGPPSPSAPPQTSEASSEPALAPRSTPMPTMLQTDEQSIQPSSHPSTVPTSTAPVSLTPTPGPTGLPVLLNCLCDVRIIEHRHPDSECFTRRMLALIGGWGCYAISVTISIENMSGPTDPVEINSIDPTPSACIDLLPPLPYVLASGEKLSCTYRVIVHVANPVVLPPSTDFEASISAFGGDGEGLPVSCTASDSVSILPGSS